MTTVTLRRKMIIPNRPNAKATYAKAKFASIQTTIQKKTSHMDVEPGLTRTRAAQVVTSTHQRLIDLAIDSLQDHG